MMGCNDGGEISFLTNNDSFSSGRKLRLLIPSPPNHSTNSPNHHQHHRHHGCGHPDHGRGSRNPDDHGLFALNHHHHLATMVEQTKREFNAAHQVVMNSRWNPTTEQLRALEEMYRRGTRTPSADQIQQISSQLRRYGKIEGKNVFYWFQNHKARERQKRRRQMESCGRAKEEKGHLNNHRETRNLQSKESGGAKTASDDVQRANNNNNTPNYNSNNSYNWEAAEGSNIDKGRESACASSSATAVNATSTSSASSTAVVTSLWMKLNDTRELLLPNSNLIITSNSMNNYDNLGRNATCPRLLPTPRPVVLPTTAGRTIFTALHSSSPQLPFPSQDFQTLQLFPLRSEEYEEDRVSYVGEDDHLRQQFFEFLPMKN